jgi:hypothetical protein
MSGATASNTRKPVTIYVRLLDEGVPVARPALAWHLTGMSFQLLGRSDNDDTDESWEFEPGATVTCEQQFIEGTAVLVAIAKER